MLSQLLSMYTQLFWVYFEQLGQGPNGGFRGVHHSPALPRGRRPYGLLGIQGS